MYLLPSCYTPAGLNVAVRDDANFLFLKNKERSGKIILICLSTCVVFFHNAKIIINNKK